MAKKKKVRVDLRKNRQKPPRDRGWTKAYQEHSFDEEATLNAERVRAKGDLSRRRTIITEDAPADAETKSTSSEMPAVDEGECLPGRVLRIQRLYSVVEADDGRLFNCVTRQLLRSLSIDERSIVATGDRVWFRPAVPTARQGDAAAPEADDTRESPAVLEGMIERVEPRHGILTRASRKREHVLVANVDQVVFVMSLVEPELKPHLLDRYLASAYQGEIQPVICLNKVDRVDPAAYQSIVGMYQQLGVPTFLTSATTGSGMEQLRRRLSGRQTVFSGQSGVGKSSLLNALEPGLGLRVSEVSEVNQKGKHTTTTSELIKLSFGGWVVDTPGVRQFELWNAIPEEMEGFFPDFHPWVALCAFPDCTHTHEDRCAVKHAVDRGLLPLSRYTSYLGLLSGESY
jgi:ribosome biogenesis GTPase